MGMLIRRHYAVAKPVKPVEQTEAISVEEKPIEDEIQAVVEETTPEEVEEEKPKKKAVVKKAPEKKRIVRRTVTKK